MSISVNKGTFATYLTDVRASKGYVDWKKGTKSVLSHIPFLGKPITGILTFFKNKFKNLFLSSNYFEDLGLYYIGPIDGNDYKKVKKTLLKAKKLEKCVIVHLKTVKGKGYEPAESSPDGFHSITGSARSENDFHSVFSAELIRLAKEDNDIVAVTPAMGIGTGLDEFGKNFPDRYFDVGIAEEHAVTFASGLAATGLKPFTAIYSTFLQRAYDSILHDAALQSLPIKLMVDRAGLSLGDGATHHGIFDVAFLSHIPNISIASPATYESLKLSIDAARAANEPFAVRYPNKSESERVSLEFYSNAEKELSLKANFGKDSLAKRVYVTYGTICENVLLATDILKEEGISAGVILLEILKPYEEIAKKAIPYLSDCKKIVFVEEGIKNGGAGMLFLDALHSLGFDFSECGYDIIAIDDNFASPDKLCDLYDYVGLSPQKIAEKMK
jgi:1-deoxy-D-xylulose-5-phosphate synthase